LANSRDVHTVPGRGTSPHAHHDTPRSIGRTVVTHVKDRVAYEVRHDARKRAATRPHGDWGERLDRKIDPLTVGEWTGGSDNDVDRRPKVRARFGIGTRAGAREGEEPFDDVANEPQPTGAAPGNLGAHGPVDRVLLDGIERGESWAQRAANVMCDTAREHLELERAALEHLRPAADRAQCDVGAYEGYDERNPVAAKSKCGERTAPSIQRKSGGASVCRVEVDDGAEVVVELRRRDTQLVRSPRKRGVVVVHRRRHDLVERTREGAKVR
jgi:hypothetical protein